MFSFHNFSQDIFSKQYFFFIIIIIFFGVEKKKKHFCLFCQLSEVKPLFSVFQYTYQAEVGKVTATLTVLSNDDTYIDRTNGECFLQNASVKFFHAEVFITCEQIYEHGEKDWEFYYSLCCVSFHVFSAMNIIFSKSYKAFLFFRQSMILLVMYDTVAFTRVSKCFRLFLIPVSTSKRSCCRMFYLA